MKRLTVGSLVFLFLGLGVALLLINSPHDAKRPLSSFDRPIGWAGQKEFDAGKLELKEADLTTVFKLYQEVSGRTVFRGAGLTQVRISLRNQTPLNRVESLQLLDTALALNRVRMVLAEDGTIKAVDSAPATNEAAPRMSASIDELPDSSSFVSVRIALKNADPHIVAVALQPFAQLPASITITPYLSFLGFPIYPAPWAARPGKGRTLLPLVKVVTLRDYSSNVRQMLQMLRLVDPTNAAPREFKTWKSAAEIGCFSSLDPPIGPAGAMQFESGALRFEEAQLQTVLDLYQKVSGRTVVPAFYGPAGVPPVKISLHNEKPLNRVETLQFLDTALAGHGITMLPCGDKLVKVVATQWAPREATPIVSGTAPLPNSRSCVSTIVRIRKASPDPLVRQLIMKATRQNSIVLLPSIGTVILRDDAASVQQMLDIIRKAER